MKLLLKNVSVTFRNKMALAGVDLQVGPGVYGVVGENGAGKTTLFRAILGLQRAKGQVVYENIQNVGYVPQHFDCLNGLRVEEALLYFACLKNIPKAEQTSLVQNTMELVNLTEEKDKKVRELSGGMLRRLGIGQAILNQPELLVMDEPTVGLDPAERMNLREIIRNIQKDRIILISSHEIHELENICENMIFIHQGRIKCSKTLEELYETYSTLDLEEIYFKVMKGECECSLR